MKRSATNGAVAAAQAQGVGKATGLIRNPPPVRPRAGLSAFLGGTVSAFSMAVVTGFLLLVNGSFVLVFLHSISETGPAWIRREDVLQFALFVVPLLMVVAQWMIWDRVRGLLSKRYVENDPWNST